MRVRVLCLLSWGAAALAGLPVLHVALLRRLVLWPVVPADGALFVLYTVPPWVMLLAVFGAGVERRRLLGGASAAHCAGRLALYGAAGPAAGLAVSPLAARFGLSGFLALALIGLPWGAGLGALYCRMMGAGGVEGDAGEGGRSG